MTDEQRPADTSLAVIEEQAEERIRREWHNDHWYFSIVDVIGVLTDSAAPHQYWRDMKRRMSDEGWAETQAKCLPLRLRAADGKLRLTDCADVETLLRIIQSVPSPKAEPIKQWLAKVGAKRLDEVTRPIDAAQVSAEMATLTKPGPEAPALAWAEYHEQLAVLYRRQAAYEVQLAYVDARLEEHDAQISVLDTQIGELHSRMESLEEGQRLLAELPELLERLGPQALTPAHQRTVQQAVKRLHEVGDYSYSTIYADLGEHFHVAKYTQIAEDQWQDVAAWFKQRIEAAERRRSH